MKSKAAKKPTALGVADLSAGVWRFPDGTTRPLTPDEWRALLS